MQRGFTKLFNTIVTSTIWTEDNETRILWITMLAISDRYGVVSGSIPGLAQVANIPVDGCRRSITKLESPDHDSRTPDFEGRRIEKIDGGWLILNHGKYRDMLSLEERKEYNRIKQQESRQRRQALSKNVKDGQTKSAMSAQAEAETEAETKNESSAHADFIAKWCVAYKTRFGEDYAFQSGKDAKAVKLLLVSSKKTPDELITIAVASWGSNGFNCRASTSISGFNSKFNEIRQELKNGANQRRTTVSSRNTGTLNEGVSSQYRGVGKVVP
jgi:hypothetical protein